MPLDIGDQACLPRWIEDNRSGIPARGNQAQQSALLGPPFSVSKVEGTGGNAKIYKANLAFPGEFIEGPESWLYPIQPPST